MVSAADDLITVQQFHSIRPDLPEAGQWSELQTGRVMHFEAPDTDHGHVVGHLTKKLLALSTVGTPVFRPPLLVDSNPDTLRYPAVAYFDSAGRFDLMDAETVEETPAWVIEIASTGDRRRAMQERVASYVNCGVRLIWVIDPRDRTLVTLHEGTQRQHGERALVDAEPISDIAFPLSDLFVVPEW